MLKCFDINLIYVCFFFNDTATTEIYTLSLHDALPIFDDPPWNSQTRSVALGSLIGSSSSKARRWNLRRRRSRSEEHTSELQSRQYLVCRLLLEKKKNNYNKHI